MAFLEIENIWRRFPGIIALKDVSLSFELGQVHILAGENGAGKSTLVKILTGTYQPSEGTVRINGRDPQTHPSLYDYIAYVPQELSLFAHMTVAENIFMPFNKSSVAQWVIDYGSLNDASMELISRFEINARPDQLVKDVPVADQQLIQIARASTNTKFKVIILDEPTSSLTNKETNRLFGIVRQLRDTGHAVVFISHKMDEIYSLGDLVTVLRNGELVGTRPMKGLDQQELIKMMSGEEVKIDQLFQSEAVSSEPIIKVSHLTGHRFQDISFDLYRGEILGFAGLIGAGRSEVMQTIFGYLKADSGVVMFENTPWKLGDTSYSAKKGFLYLSEERRLHGIFPLLSVRENVGISTFHKTLSTLGVISRVKEIDVVNAIVETYAVKTSSIDKKIVFLSGGNQQKIIIGRAMQGRPKILVFDEPTKGIDIKTKVEIYRLMKQLAEQGVGIILISSEMDELRKCANRILTMYNGKINGEFMTDKTTNQQLVGAILGSEKECNV